MNKKHSLVDSSTETYSKKKLSKPKFILTLFLTIVVSASLVVGGTMSYFSMQSNHFITVNGKEVITPEIAEAIQSQINASSLPDQQKLTQVMQALNPRQESLMWIAYAQSYNLNFQAPDLVNALKTTYEEEKERYQKENKNYYNIPYLSFVKQNTDIFNVQSIFGAISIPSHPDYYNIAVEYAADKTYSTIAYRSIDIKDFIVKTKQKELELFYTRSKNKMVGAKILKVISFASSNEADKVAKELQKDSNLAKEKFKTAQENITVSKNTPESYIYVQNVNIGEITPGFTYKGKNYVGLVQANQELSFGDLEEKDKLEFAKQYETSLNQKDLDIIIHDIKKNLTSENKAPFIQEGISAPIKMSKSEDAKDSKTLNSLNFGSVNNLEFFTQVFSNQGYESSPLNYMDFYYTFKVIKRINPVFPIPQQEYSDIQSIIKNREDSMWFRYHTLLMRKDVDVQVNTKNINRLLGIEEK